MVVALPRNTLTEKKETLCVWKKEGWIDWNRPSVKYNSATLMIRSESSELIWIYNYNSYNYLYSYRLSLALGGWVSFEHRFRLQSLFKNASSIGFIHSYFERCCLVVYTPYILLYAGPTTRFCRWGGHRLLKKILMPKNCAHHGWARKKTFGSRSSKTASN